MSLQLPIEKIDIRDQYQIRFHLDETRVNECEMDDGFFKIAEKRIAEAPVPPIKGEIVLAKPNDEQGYLRFPNGD